MALLSDPGGVRCTGTRESAGTRDVVESAGWHPAVGLQAALPRGHATEWSHTVLQWSTT